MCEFFSCLVLKSGEVFWIPGVDGHSELHEALKKKMPGLTDNTADPDKLLFARVEITPPNGDVFERDVTKWNFRIDESITPSWWTPDHEKKARRSLSDCLDEVLIDGQTITLLENRNGLFIRNSKIEVLKACNVREMRGSSQVREMWGSSQVGEMRESSQVGVMRESSQVGEMWGSSQVREMWGSSQVGEMRGSSQVREMWGSSQVGVMRESSQVGVMWESSQANIYSDEAKYSIEKGSNGLVILRYKKNIEIVHATDTKVALKKYSAPKKVTKKK